MKATLNIIAISLTVSACAAVLSACDGRATTPFKPVAYSQDELAMHKQDFDKVSGTQVAPGSPSNMTNGSLDPKKVSSTASSGDGKVVLAPAQPPVNPGSAVAKSYIDRDGNLGIVSALTTEIETLIQNGDTSGATVLKGVDFHLVGDVTSPNLAMEARLFLQDQPVNMTLNVEYKLDLGTDGKVKAMPLNFSDRDGVALQSHAIPSVVGYAFCHETCRTVYLLFLFNTATPVEAVVILQDGQIVRSNLSANNQPVLCYQTAVDPKLDCDGKVKEAAASTTLTPAPKTDTLKSAERYLRLLKMISRNQPKATGTTTVAQDPATSTVAPKGDKAVGPKKKLGWARKNLIKPTQVADPKAGDTTARPTKKKLGWARKDLAKPTVEAGKLPDVI